MKDREPDQATRSALQGKPAGVQRVEGGRRHQQGHPALPVGELAGVGADRRLQLVVPAAGAAGAGRAGAGAGPVLRLVRGGRPDQRHEQPGVLGRRRLGPVAGLRRAHLRLPCADDDQGGTTPPKVGDLCWRSDNAIASYNGGGRHADPRRRHRHLADQERRRLADRTAHRRRQRRQRRRVLEDHDDRRHPVLLRLRGRPRSPPGPCRCSATTRASPAMPAPSTPRTASRPGGGTWTRSSTGTATCSVYTYETETNSYGLNKKDAAVSYVRAGTLKRGRVRPAADDAAVKATGRVEFTIADRCVPGSDCTPDKKDNWPDVAWDDKCDDGHLQGQALADVLVDQAPGQDHHPGPARRRLHRRRLVDPGPAVPRPGRRREGRAVAQGHHPHGPRRRHDHAAAGDVRGHQAGEPGLQDGDGYAPLIRYRVTGVVSEAGGVMSVKYAEPNCVAGTSMPANPESNTLRCFPASGGRKKDDDRAHRLLPQVRGGAGHPVRPDEQSSTEQVTSVHTSTARRGTTTPPSSPRTTSAPGTSSAASAGSGSAPASRGDPSGPIGKTEQRFYRGMHGDKQPSGTRTASVRSPARARPARTRTGCRACSWSRSRTTGRHRPRWSTRRSATRAGRARPRPGARSRRTWCGRERRQNYTALAAGGWRSTRTEYRLRRPGTAHRDRRPG